MNKRILKPIMSLVLVVVMAVSTMMVSVVPTSATGNVEYKFDIQTAGSSGKSSNKISIKVNGENGSTSWHNVGKVANAKKDNCDFTDINVGAIKSITVKNNGSDGWYPEIINITKGGTTTTIFGGRWVDDEKEVTLSVTDRAAKVTVKTSDESLAGTDDAVIIKLVDDKGNETGVTNLSDIHPKVNAFERCDEATFYIYVPENFGELTKIVLDVDKSNSIMDDWVVEYVDVTLDGKIRRFCSDNTTGNFYPAYNYKVTVKTGDEICAGTDCNVWLTAFDENNKMIRVFHLDNGENNFEQNDTDVFYISTTRKIGNISVSTNHDSIFTWGGDWYLDYIQLDLFSGLPSDSNIVESVRGDFGIWIGSNVWEPVRWVKLPVSK